jgi:type 1 glutamine amidotransferase
MKFTFRNLVPAILSLWLLSTLAVGAAPKRILVLTESRGFTHDVVKRGDDDLCVVEKIMAKIGGDSGVFETVNSQSAIEALTAENLKHFDAVFFYTTGSLIPDGGPRNALLDFVKSGKAFIGTHSATDTFSDFSGYYQFINGTFNGHPWTSGMTSTFSNHEPSHPAVAMFPESFEYKDEIYQYKNYSPESVRVLLSLDMGSSSLKRPYMVPVCWVRSYGRGRLFYTNFGHNKSTWEDSRYQDHVLQGIRWALGLIDGPSSANPQVQQMQNVRSFLAVASSLAGDQAASLNGDLKAKAAQDDAFLKRISGQVESFQKMFKDNNLMGKVDEWNDAQVKFARQVLDAISK